LKIAAKNQINSKNYLKTIENYQNEKENNEIIHKDLSMKEVFILFYYFLLFSLFFHSISYFYYFYYFIFLNRKKNVNSF